MGWGENEGGEAVRPFTEEELASKDYRELIKALCEKAQLMLEMEICEFRDSYLGLLSTCESPIEQMMAIALTGHALVQGYFADDSGLDLKGQQEVCHGEDTYRVDFVLSYKTPSNNELRFAVECDGHDFHEKTKEQAARDKKRDRALSAQGYTVIRFTGSEVYAAPWRCAKEVFDLLKLRLEN